MNLKTIFISLVLISTQVAFGETTTTEDCNEPQNFEFEAALPQERRVSIKGIEFLRNTSIPELGEAYAVKNTKNQSVTIWGDVVMDPEDSTKPKYMNPIDAKAYCACNTERAIKVLKCPFKIGQAHLPTEEDFAQLREYLGYNDGNYTPYVANSYGEEILPGLTGNDFWSGWHYSGYALYFYNGDIISSYRSDMKAVRCVARL